MPLLNLIAAGASREGTCRTPQASLARELGRSVRHVRTGERALERLGLVRVHRLPGGGRRRVIEPAWHRPRAAELSTSYPQSVENLMDTTASIVVSHGGNRKHTSGWWGGATGSVLPVARQPVGVEPSLSARACARAQTENLEVSTEVISNEGDPRARAPSVRVTGRPWRALARELWALSGGWANLLPEVEHHLGIIARAEGEDQLRRWIAALSRRLNQFPAPRRGAVALGAVRARARQAAPVDPGLYDRPLEALP
jgi:hypothetical protein